MLDQRARTLLKNLIESYIADGQPVGSRTLSRHPGMMLSPATIRNVMADLEEAGLISSPHTSAGRIPTAQGYRVFIDSLLTIQPPRPEEIDELRGNLQPDAPDRVIRHASQLLSDLTHFAGIVAAPPRTRNKLRHIEFIGLGERRILLIMVSTAGEVQNRLLMPERDYSASELIEAANYLNAHCLNKNFGQIRTRLKSDLRKLSSDMKELLSAVLAATGESADADAASRTVVYGEKNLLDAQGLSSNMRRLRQLFDLFEQRTALMRLLDHAQAAHGVRVYIGSESGIATLDDCSVVAAPYRVNGRLIGAVGVVGPTRMDYERVIPIVDITAQLLSNALSTT
jgi:heat-inducible transcriptional repressor